LIVAGVDSPVVRELIPAAFSRVATVGIDSGEWRASNIQSSAAGMIFDVSKEETHVGQFSIPMLGTFNVRNALDVIVTSKEIGVDDRVLQSALSSFKSVKRRLELKAEVNGVRVYDDFAHHPTAVLETLSAVRQRYPQDRIWAVFEPRSQTCRRRIFESAFIKAFEPADAAVIARVFGSSKLAPEDQLSPERLVEGIQARGRTAATFDTTAEIVEFVAREAVAGDHVVVMSNGGFDGIHGKLLSALRNK
jgi:UDP-N-acetylmuramate: L-alanyl-gamma-D-glutamyl-meso-diaminopimelate ligase